MFDTEDKVNKMLGEKGPKRPDPNMLEQGFRQGVRPMRNRMQGMQGMRGTTSNDIIMQIQTLLDKIPDVKKAKGNINIEFEDGTKSVVQLVYDEQPFKK